MLAVEDTMSSSSSDNDDKLNEAILASDSQEDDSDTSHSELNLNDGIIVVSETNDESEDENNLRNNKNSLAKTPSCLKFGSGWRSVASTTKKKKVLVDLCFSSSDDDEKEETNHRRKPHKELDVSNESNYACTDSEDDEFEKFLTKTKTPKTTQKHSFEGHRDASFVVLSSDEENDGPEFHLSLRTTPFKKPGRPILTSRTPAIHHNFVNHKKGSMTEPRNSKFSVISKKKEEIKTSPRLSFLASLNSDVDINKCDTAAVIYHKSFKKHKDELAQKLFSLFNCKIFNNQLSPDMEIAWNSRMTKTAGFCYSKRLRPSGIRYSRIELAPKVVDNAERLRDTLIHELCHAAVWVIDGIMRDGHGPLWKQWTFRARRAFPELPPISRSHTYAIHTKFVYKCTLCPYKIGRHSKSIDTTKKCCPHCRSSLQVFRSEKTEKAVEDSSPPLSIKSQKNRNDDEIEVLNSDFVRMLEF